MTNRRRSADPCKMPAHEKFFPVCGVGLILIFAGLAMAFLSFVFGFWMAFLGAVLVLIGYLVVQSC